MTIFCSAPFVFAAPPHDVEYFYLISKSGIILNNNVPTVHEHYYGSHCPDWFTAKKWDDGSYSFICGQHKIVQILAMAEDVSSSKIFSEFFIGCGNQRWVFKDVGDGYYRIKNVRTDRYLTYNPPDRRVYGYQKCGMDDQLWRKI